MRARVAPSPTKWMRMPGTFRRCPAVTGVTVADAIGGGDCGNANTGRMSDVSDSADAHGRNRVLRAMRACGRCGRPNADHLGVAEEVGGLELLDADACLDLPCLRDLIIVADRWDDAGIKRPWRFPPWTQPPTPSPIEPA